jgi:hypothetical protein
MPAALALRGLMSEPGQDYDVAPNGAEDENDIGEHNQFRDFNAWYLASREGERRRPLRTR